MVAPVIQQEAGESKKVITWGNVLWLTDSAAADSFVQDVARFLLGACVVRQANSAASEC